MIEISDEEIAAAQERGRIADEMEARATSAYYDRKTGRMVLELKYNSTFSFPARLAQGLEHATDDEIAEVQVIGLGYGLHWEALDADHAVPALVAGLFGTRKYMASLVERGVLPARWSNAAAPTASRKTSAAS